MHTREDEFHDEIMIVEWFENNKMCLNVKKCAVVTYTRRAHYVVGDYYIKDEKVQRENVFKDLGVTFQMNTNFSSHYIAIINKAYRALGFVTRNSDNFQIATIVKLYNALVRPHVEYASIIWSPVAYSNSDMIEKVQKRFLRFLYLRKNKEYPYLVSYRAMLKTFEFQMLCTRREMQAFLYIYYIVNSIRYKDCELIKYISFKVPKTRLRLCNKEPFYIDKSNTTSPVNNMLKTCNDVVNKVGDVDIFNIKNSELRRLLEHQDWA